MAIEDQIREIRTQISQQQTRVTRAQVEKENAERRRDQAAETLRGFGVTSTEEARAKLTQLQGELDTAVSDIEAQLKEAGA
jgi:cell division protein ZapA (FtsZ GTPase activity inhibitor)